MKLALLALIAILPAASHAVPLHCLATDVQTVQAKVDPKGEKTFPYKYKYVKRSESPDALTIIHLPGGPGEPSIELGEIMMKGLPKEANLIFTDPRTVGCNEQAVGVIPDETITSQHLAHDVMTMIKELGLKNYMLYGISYGTTLATVTQDLLQKNGMGAKALVLEGTVYPISESWLRIGYNSVIKRVLDQAKPGVKEKILAISDDKPGPLGKSAREWADFLTSPILQIGYAPVWGKMMLNVLDQGLADGADMHSQEQLKLFIGQIASGNGQNETATGRVYKQIACHEIFPIVPVTKTLARGRIRAAPDTKYICDGSTFDRPFRVSDYTLKTKIYYVHGSEDPNTPIGLARNHFRIQKESERVFFQIQDAGHNPSQSDPECMSAIWKLIESGASSDGGTLESVCKLKVTTAHRSRGE